MYLKKVLKLADASQPTCVWPVQTNYTRRASKSKTLKASEAVPSDGTNAMGQRRWKIVHSLLVPACHIFLCSRAHKAES